ncbi:MAG: helix-turn-helix domain-containing protein [Desulforhopalus sp.]|nr:helix-turn-helix domain-containing protein [Desulforhopalus sp.]
MIIDYDVQIIKESGRPAFVVVPYAKWIQLSGDNDAGGVYIPSEVRIMHAKTGLSLIASWRRHLKITQRELAEDLGMTQPAIAQIEKAGTKNRPETLEKIAHALKIEVEQLTVNFPHSS